MSAALPMSGQPPSRRAEALGFGMTRMSPRRCRWRRVGRVSAGGGSGARAWWTSTTPRRPWRYRRGCRRRWGPPASWCATTLAVQRRSPPTVRVCMSVHPRTLSLPARPGLRMLRRRGTLGIPPCGLTAPRWRSHAGRAAETACDADDAASPSSASAASGSSPAGRRSRASFANDGELLVISQESLAALNRCMARMSPATRALTAASFRPNVVLAGTAGAGYEEEAWRALQLAGAGDGREGGCVLESTGGCTRCGVICQRPLPAPPVPSLVGIISGVGWWRV